MPRRNRDTIVIAVPKGRVLEQLGARLEKAGIPTECIRHGDYPDRESFDRAVAAVGELAGT